MVEVRVCFVMNISKNLRRLRKNAGLTQFELATKADLVINTISRIETDALMPRVETLEKIADALGVKVEALVKS